MDFITQNFGAFKLVVDMALVVALVYVGARILRAPAAHATAARAGELETALRNLVKDAEGASRQLNDQLMKRQQNLEKLLFDLEGAEQRINGSLQSATEAHQTIDSRIALAKQALAEIAKRAPAPSVGREPVASQPLAAEVVRTVELARIAPEPPSFEQSVRPEPVITRRATNIYGDEIGVDLEQEAAPLPQSAPQPARSGNMGRATQRYLNTLSSRVEREIESGAGPSRSVEEVYDAAEKLLRAGKDLAFVASATNLPMEEVESLSRMTSAPVSVTSSIPAPGGDPRLGVLGSLKRQTQVL